MKVNFAQIEIEGLEGKEKLDVRKALGNYLYYQSRDLAGSQLGKDIYLSKADIELDDEKIKLVQEAVEKMYQSYIIKVALEKALGVNKG